MKYGKVTDAIVAELKALLGANNVIADAERMEAYSHDETSAEEYGHMPEVVVTPTSTVQVAEVVKLANRATLPVTPRGAGSGLSGGAIPVYGGIVLSLEKMNKVIEIDYANMTMTVETGIVTNEINNLIKERGLFYAGYPMSLETCFLGGNIAENAGGGKAVKYGVTSRYIMGLELVTPIGDVVWLGGKLAKDVTGYDLTHLIVGSEGTLGIVTTAIIRLIGLPKAKSDLLVLFKTPAEAIACVPEIIAKGTIPTSIEFMDKLSVETSCAYLNESLPYETCGAMLLIEMDGTDADQVDADAEAVRRPLHGKRRHRSVYGRQPYYPGTRLEREAEHRRGIQGPFAGAEPRGHRRADRLHTRHHPRTRPHFGEIRHLHPLLRARWRRQPPRHPRQGSSHVHGSVAHS